MRYTNDEIVEGTDFPGQPSGERPCCFCIRNADREQWQKDLVNNIGSQIEVWYDQSQPIKVPMDCYHSVDMKRQISQWTE